MFEHYEIRTVPMTPDDVLGVFIEWHRQQARSDPEADPDAVLSFEMTIAEWSLACDLIPWRRLGPRLNVAFRTNFDEEDWRRVLTPARTRTPADVCALIATRARREVIEPLELLGRPCAAAGAFLAVREILRAEGADVSDLRPSTPLADYLRGHLGAFFDRIARLSPGTLPPPRADVPAHDVAVYVHLAGAASVLGSYCLGLGWRGTVAGAALALIGVVAANCTARARPKSVSLGNLHTFRDLARTLTHERPGGFPVRPVPSRELLQVET